MFHVLIVEDEFWMCEGLKKIFHKLEVGFTVADTAANGQEALKKLQSGGFDLVVSDIRMPIMDGLELMKEMKSSQINLPVVIITGHDEFEYARTAFRLGAVDYLLKPVKSNELKEVLEHLSAQLGTRNQTENDDSLYDWDELARGNELVQTILKRIQQDYMEDLSLSEIADQAGFNASYLSRLFKMETGKGFVQYLREVRLEHAARMLRDTNLTIERISKRVGFQDEKYFRRTFKQELGLTPSEFRKRYEK